MLCDRAWLSCWRHASMTARRAWAGRVRGALAAAARTGHRHRRAEQQERGSPGGRYEEAGKPPARRGRLLRPPGGRGETVKRGAARKAIGFGSRWPCGPASEPIGYVIPDMAAIRCWMAGSSSETACTNGSNGVKSLRLWARPAFEKKGSRETTSFLADRCKYRPPASCSPRRLMVLSDREFSPEQRQWQNPDRVAPSLPGLILPAHCSSPCSCRSIGGGTGR